jgi:predicted NUDIX family phosphoesterase
MEYVYVVPREDLFPDCYPHGLVPFGGESAGALLNTEESFIDRASAEGFFVERPRAERTPAWKQIIPYGVVVCDDRILIVKRLAQGGESRLHDKLSIGIGGHINPVDDDSSEGQAPAEGTNLFSAAALRELEEELTIEGTYTTRSIGVLNDDSNPVGAVHLGLVLVVQVRGTVEIRETDVLAGEWASREELKARLAAGANFETWSRLLVEQIDTFLPHSQVPVS